MSDNGIITKRITKSITESSPLSSGAELQIQKISAKAKYRIIGNPLTLIISAMALEACGNSLGKISIGSGGDNAGSGDGNAGDGGAGSGGVGTGVTEMIFGDSNDKEDRSVSDLYSWSSGERITIYEQSVQVEDTVRLNGVNIADVSFSRQHTGDAGVYTTADVTLSIAGQSVVILPYTEIASVADTYYQGVEKVHFDTDDNSIVDAGELELNLIYQRQFNDGDVTADQLEVTTTGTDSADLIIGFDIAGFRDSSDNFVRDFIRAGAGNDYVYGLDGDDYIIGGAGNDVLYGGAGDDELGGKTGNDILYGGAGSDRFFFSKGYGDDTIIENANEGVDTLVLERLADTTDVQIVERVDDSGMVSETGNHLKLTFTDTASGASGGSVVLRDSINSDDTGVDRIHFDSDGDEIEDDGEIIWLDETFVTRITTEIIYGDSNDKEVRSGSDPYIWSSGERITIYEQLSQGDDTVRLKGVNIADVSFSRQHTGDAGVYTTTEVTLSIAGESGVSVILPYTEIAGVADTYYQGVEKVHFDTDDNGIVDAGELELNLIYQRQFNDGDVTADQLEVTTTGTDSADLIIGFDIAGAQDSSDNFVRDFIRAGAGNDYVYGLDGDDYIIGGAGNDVLYGGAGDDELGGKTGNDILYGGAGSDRFFFSKGYGDDTIIENANESVDTLVLERLADTTDVQIVERVDDSGMVSETGNHLKLTFTDTASGASGGSVVLKDSFNNDDTGVDRIHFDSDGDEIEDDGEIIWLDETYGGYVSNSYSWSSGERITIYEKPNEGTYDTVRLNGVNIADVSFSRNPVSGDQFTTADVTLTIAGESGVSVILPYEQYDSNGDGTIGGTTIGVPDDEYYQGVEKVHFDTDGNDMVDTGELVLNLIYQNQFNGVGAAVAASDTVTTAGSGEADLIIGFDIADLRDSSGNYVRDYIRAGAGDDYVYGGAGFDALYGDAGNDEIYGGVGSDLLNGGIGNDNLYGEAGNDTIYGEAGDDTIYGGADIDTLYGGADVDTIYGGADVDTLYGEAGNDFVYGNDGNDTLHGGAGSDSLYGGADVDTLYGEAGNDFVYGNDGNDTLHGGADDDTLYGGEGNDELRGGFVYYGSVDSLLNTGNDVLYGGAGDDSLYGGDGDDTLYGGAGDDNLYGNAGDDRFYFERGDGDDEITENANEGDDTLVLSGFSTTDVQSVERVNDAGTMDTNGSHLKLIFAPTASGASGGSILLKDSINATAVAPDDDTGVDRIHFDSNDDGIVNNNEIVWRDEDFATRITTEIIYGGPDDTAGQPLGGDNSYSWSSGQQITIYERPGDGTDKLILSGVDTADVTFGRNHVVSVPAVDSDKFTTAYVTLSIAGQAGVSVVLPYTEITGVTDTYYKGVEKVHFDTDSDGIIDDGEPYLKLFYQRQFNDGVAAGRREITTTGTGFADLIIGFDIAGTLVGGSYVGDGIRTGAGDDYVYGLDGDDWLEGYGGNDVLYGGAGNDRLEGETGNDNLYGGAGNDTILSNAGDDNLYGGAGNDFLNGGAGNDSLSGGAGNDDLYGSAGDDTLNGGAGDDEFSYSKGWGNDEITENANEGYDILVLNRFRVTDVQSVERVDDNGMVDIINGSHLKLTFTDTAFGGSILLKDSFNNDETGIEVIHFDTVHGTIDYGLEDPGDTVWLDENFAGLLT